MPEEKPAVEDLILNRIEMLHTEMKDLRGEFDRRFNSLEQRAARLEGGFDQMDKRMTNIEQLQRWVLGIMITSWLTLVGLTVTILAKLL